MTTSRQGFELGTGGGRADGVQRASEAHRGACVTSIGESLWRGTLLKVFMHKAINAMKMKIDATVFMVMEYGIRRESNHKGTMQRQTKNGTNAKSRMLNGVKLLEGRTPGRRTGSNC